MVGFLSLVDRFPHTLSVYQLALSFTTSQPWDFNFPPLFYVYPDRFCLRVRGSSRPELIAMCGCGVCGRPTDLAWAGPHCGPCADHREERVNLGLPFEEPPGLLHGDDCAHSLTFSPNSRLLLGRRLIDMPWGWDVRTGRPAWERPDRFWGSLAFSPAGDWFVASNGTAATHLAMFDTATGHFRSRLMEFAERAVVAISPDGATLAVGDRARVSLYRLPATEAAEPEWSGFAHAADSLQFTPDGRHLIIWTGVGATCLSIGDYRVLWQRGANAGPAISPDGEVVAVPNQTSVSLFEMSTGRVIGHLPTGVHSNGVAFHPRLRHLVTGHANGSLVMWSLAGYQRHTMFLAQQAGITALAMSPDGRTLATAASDGTVKLWPWEELLLV